MEFRRILAGIAFSILLTVVPSVFGQGSGNAPPTLPVETAILQDYHPDDLSDRINARAPYDKRPFPSPWEELDWHELVQEALRVENDNGAPSELLNGYGNPGPLAGGYRVLYARLRNSAVR